MSIWTHVAGIVRVNDFRFDESKINWNKVFGREIRFDSSDRTWHEYAKHPEKFMPCGSEGSLQRSVWVNPDNSHVAAYTISIFGDLRDYSDTDKIIAWFKESCDKMWVRQACITVQCEAGDKQTYTYKEVTE